MRKLKFMFKRLSKNTGKIRVEEALVISKQMLEDFLFSEEELYQLVEDDLVEETRKLTEKNFYHLIKNLKRRLNQLNEPDTLLAYVAMGGASDRGGYVDA